MGIEHQALQNISTYAGNRFDLVQAGGGNSSVKMDNNQMLIKASGINLSQVDENNGYVTVNYQNIRTFLETEEFKQKDKKQREHAAAEAMKTATLSTTGKPSIETFLHALLKKHTLHTHPITVNILAATSTWKEDLQHIWPDAVCVPYETPGIDLAIAMQQEIRQYQKQHNTLPKVVFLQNHGLIVSSDDLEEVEQLTEAITQKIESQLTLDFSHYRAITQLQHLIKKATANSVHMILSTDSIIKKLVQLEPPSTSVWPFCPDTLIYCGIKPLYLKQQDDLDSVAHYAQEYQDFPRVIMLNNQVYFCAPTLKKAKEAEELLRFHLMVIQHTGSKTQRLDMQEIAYLSNWDAEKYRQGV